jgi:hypothetical protein
VNPRAANTAVAASRMRCCVASVLVQRLVAVVMEPVMHILSSVERNSEKPKDDDEKCLLKGVTGRVRSPCGDSDAAGSPVPEVAPVTTPRHVLLGQKSLMYGPATSCRATLTTCVHWYIVGGIVNLWR